MNDRNDAQHLIELLHHRLEKDDTAPLYSFLETGETHTVGETFQRAMVLAAYLQQRHIRDQPIALLYPPGFSYIVAFLGVLMSRNIAVPLYPPQSARRADTTVKILIDAGVSMALTLKGTVASILNALHGTPCDHLELLTEDDLADIGSDLWKMPDYRPEHLAFLQYTSGSTGDPKGVMVSHGNLIANERAIAHAFGTLERDICLNWLPAYHDMGLIGAVLHPLYRGFHSVMMAPTSFSRDPISWLEAITAHRATVCGAPDFGYKLCVDRITEERLAKLDLSSWRVAFNGAEPVRAGTLDSFKRAFSRVGFDGRAFMPCYGLAEATLLVTCSSGSEKTQSLEVNKDELALNRVALEEDPSKSLSYVSCGKFAPEHHVKIVNPQTLELSRDNEIGEIWVSGPSVTMGYWRKKQLTDQTFQVPIVGLDDARYLRTGDLGFKRAGLLYVTGRLKDLIIIRGKNHYPQDIESTTSESSDAFVPSGVVAFSVDVAGEEKLVVLAELKRSAVRQADRQALIALAIERIGEKHQLSPHVIGLVSTGSLPKTSSGKIRRRASKQLFLDNRLPLLDKRVSTVSVDELEAVSELVASKAEAEFLQFLCEVIGANPQDILKNKPLIYLGLDSLSAIRSQQYLETRFGLSVSLEDLFQGISFGEIVALLPESDRPSGVEVPSTKVADSGTLSTNQYALWLEQQLNPGTGAYNLSFAVEIAPLLIESKLETALVELQQRHDLLRSTYRLVDGVVYRHVAENCDPSFFEQVDGQLWDDHRLQDYLSEQAQTVFDLEHGPIFRVRLISRDRQRQVLFVCVHHIVLDYHGGGVLLEELEHVYQGNLTALPRLTHTYNDFIARQLAYTGSDQATVDEQFWLHRLSGPLPVLDLATDFPRPKVQSLGGKSHTWIIKPETVAGLKQLSQQSETTVHALLLAIFQTLLYRYTDQRDLLIGMPTTQRSPDFSHVMGYFINPVVVRAQLEPTAAFAVLAKQVHTAIYQALDHRSYPFAALVDRLGTERDPSRPPLFSVMFNHQTSSEQAQGSVLFTQVDDDLVDFAGSKMKALPFDNGEALVDLTLTITHHQNRLIAKLIYNKSLFKPETIARMAQQYQSLLECVCENPAQELRLFPLFSEGDQETLAFFNSVERLNPAERSPFSLFAKQAAATPENRALIYKGEAITYTQLFGRVACFASYLARHGLGPEKGLAICCEDELSTRLAILACGMVGAYYIPLDPHTPGERLDFMIQDACPHLLLVNEGSPLQKSALAFTPAQATAGLAHSFLLHNTTGNNTCYVIYTSGSTGKPKGVQIPAHAVTTLLEAVVRQIAPDQNDIFAVLSNTTFDISVPELFVPLSVGASAVIIPRETRMDMQALLEVLLQSEATVVQNTPSIWRALVSLQWKSTPKHTLISAGEPLSTELAQNLCEGGARVINYYGPTETTIYSTSFFVPPGLVGEMLLGRPLGGSSVMITDPFLQLRPVGVIGEIVVSGTSGAIGYFNQPALTAAAFVPDPFSEIPGSRLYRTGDLGRLRDRETLTFQGRFGRQVKLRGYRIELDEIEIALSTLEMVQQAAVICYGEESQRRLVAFLVPKDVRSFDFETLQALLRDRLPEYMLPSAWITLGAMPLNASGKIDRKALKPPQIIEQTRGIVPPRMPLEKIMADIWQDVLGVARVGINDHFFRLGGHSLSATRFVLRFKEVTTLDMPIRLVFQYPTIKELAAHLPGANPTALPPLTIEENCNRFPLSFAQQRVWFLEKQSQLGSAYNLPIALELRGQLCIASLTAALNQLLERHPSLQTRISSDHEETLQWFDASATFPLHITSESNTGNSQLDLSEICRREGAHPFNLDGEALVRAHLLQTAPSHHLLMITFHHLVADGISLEIVAEDFARLYTAAIMGETLSSTSPRPNYGDFSLWQRRCLKYLDHRVTYWMQQLQDIPALIQLPTDFPRNNKALPCAGHFDVQVKVNDAVLGLRDEAGATPFALLLSAYAVMLSRYSNQDDVVIGTPFGGRATPALANMVGFFANTVPLRLTVDGRMTFRSLLRRASQVILDAQVPDDIPFEKLVEVLAPERGPYSPIFQVMLAMQPNASRTLTMPGLDTRVITSVPAFSKFDLSLVVEDHRDEWVGYLEYDKSLFYDRTASLMVEHLNRLLERLTNAPDQPLYTISMLSDETIHRLLVTWNTASELEPSHEHILGRFAKECLVHGQRTAIISEGLSYTYAEVLQLSEDIGQRFSLFGVRPGALVGVSLDRCAEMLPVLLGIFRCGAAYVPMDPSYPRERLAIMIKDAGIERVVTQFGYFDLFADHEVQLIERKQLFSDPIYSPNPWPPLLLDQVAYLLFTSGSTGRPKGVSVTHRGLSSLINWAGHVYDAQAFSGVLAATSLNFDLSIFELFVTLCHGGTIILAKDAMDLPNLSARNQVRLINSVPSLIAELLRQGGVPSSVEVVNLAGEALSPSLVDDLYATGFVRDVYNLYGPSEDSTYSTWARQVPLQTEATIGQTLPHTTAYVLDRSLNLVAPGVTGELYLGGEGLAQGYYCRPSLTAQSFLPNPFGAGVGLRFYKTGDLVRYREDGNLVFLGRIDFQIKLRGFRIELGDIEYYLNKLTGVHQAVVIHHRDVNNSQHLVAYVACDDVTLTPEDLRKALAGNLAEYMIPNLWVIMDKLPLTPNGKINRKALPEPQPGGSNAYQEPETTEERQLAKIFAQVLGLERIGVHDNFFHLGGHSLIIAKLLGRIGQVFGCSLKASDIFNAPTVAGLAALLAQMETKHAFQPIIASRDPDALVPLTSAQNRLWTIYRIHGPSALYNIPFATRFEGELHPLTFESALRRVVARHTILSARFTERKGEVFQFASEPGSDLIKLLDLANQEPDFQARQCSAVLAAEHVYRFDLEREFLLRCTLIKNAADAWFFVFNVHHIIFDGWSADILLKELSLAYAAELYEAEPSFDPLPISYFDFARHEKTNNASEHWQKKRAWWFSHLQDAPPLLALPTDFLRPEQQSFAGSKLEFEFDAQLAHGLQCWSLNEGATLFMALMTPWLELLGRYGMTRDLVVGTPVANRERVETEQLVGFFVNMLPLRVTWDRVCTVKQLLQRVRATVIDGFDHQEIPFDQIVDDINPRRTMSYTPLFQVTFTFLEIKAQTQGVFSPGLQLIPLGYPEQGQVKFDLELNLRREGDRLIGMLNWCNALFERATIERMVLHYTRLAQAMVNAPLALLSTLQIIGAGERKVLLDQWACRPRPIDLNRTITELFEDQVARVPDLPALVSPQEGLEFTFRTLNRRANVLAWRLRRRGLSAGHGVAMYLPRCADQLVGILGIIKAGGFYIPIDPNMPWERVTHILADAQPRMVLTQNALAGCFENIAVVLCDGDDDGPSKCLDQALIPTSPVYAIFTSGSTGKPKGVVICHNSLVNFVHAHNEIAYENVGEHLKIGLNASFSFDATCQQWTRLAMGDTIYLIPDEARKDAALLARFLNDHAIDVLDVTPTMMRFLLPHLEADKARPARILLGGEAVDPDLWKRALALPHTRTFNFYGPTEATVESTGMPLEVSPALPSIGRVVINHHLYITGPDLQLLPLGLVGELSIGGVGLSMGYLSRPRLTAQGFVPNPFSTIPGERLYRTGDLVRYTNQGYLVYHGRTDHQIKLRGFRIELGEIEHVMLQHPAVKAAAVIVRGDGSSQRIDGYFTIHESMRQDFDELRSFLQHNLPDYMCPQTLTLLSEMPLNVSGKIDRNCLAEPAPSQQGLNHVAPRNEIETLIAGIWMELLAIDRVSIHDNFFKLGGHSLLATQMISRLTEACSCSLNVSELFENPTIAALAQRLTQAGESTVIMPVPREERPLLSYSQERLWFLEQLTPSSSYHITGGLLFKGLLSCLDLDRALQGLLIRQESLRTTFHGDEQGVYLRISQNVEHKLSIVDYSAEEGAREKALEIARNLNRLSFCLEQGPLFRGCLVRITEHEHLLLVSMHHIIADGWSVSIFINDLITLYGAYQGRDVQIPSLPVQYADYAKWQRDELEGSTMAKGLAYWDDALCDIPNLLVLPYDRPRPARQTYRGANLPFIINEEMLETLNRYCRSSSSTLFMTLFSCFSVLLYHYTHQKIFTIGTPVANRNRLYLERIIGLFINTLVLKSDFGDNPSFAQLLNATRKTILEAYAHQDIPFEKLVERLQPSRDTGHSPLFQVMLILQNTPEANLKAPGLEFELLEVPMETAKFDLTLSFSNHGRALIGNFEYNCDLFEEDTIRSMSEHLKKLIRSVQRDSDIPVSRLSLLTDADLQSLLITLNTEMPIPEQMNLSMLLRRTIATSPNRHAVSGTGLDGEPLVWSYRQLGEQVDKLARRLAQCGVTTETPIGVFMPRGPHMLACLLAVLEAGGCYLPMDPIYPPERLTDMLEQAQAAVVMSTSHLVEAIEFRGAQILFMDHEATCSVNLDFARPALECDQLAYVIFTSGSTGRPKGVQISHGALVNFLLAMIQALKPVTDDRLLAVTTLSFDIAALELFMPLCVGAEVVIADAAETADGPRLGLLVTQRDITMMQATPATWELLLSSGWSGKSDLHILCGGEAMPATLANKLLKCGRRLNNLYGPTETTVWSLCLEMVGADILTNETAVSIGQPIANTTFYVQNRWGTLVPRGVSGELYIGGSGLARGYRGQPSLSATRFVPDPYTTLEGRRLYRTGDLVRMDIRHGLQYLGRIDHQVKLRGFRIEVGEIEQALRYIDGVRQAAVTLQGEGQDQFLVAFLVAEANSTLAENGYREELSSKLPHYMIPSRWMVLDALPQTPNGKLDRKALPICAAGGSGTFVGPRTSMESALAKIWSEILNFASPSVVADFFELGGHSLMATRIKARVLQELQIDLPVQIFFQQPTIERMAQYLETAQNSTRTIIPKVSRELPLPLSYVQMRLWFLQQLEPEAKNYHIPAAMVLEGALDSSALEASLNDLVERHESLRTRLVLIDDLPCQIIDPSSQIHFTLIEIVNHHDETRLMNRWINHVFDLEHGPLLRVALFRLAPQRHVLLLVVHHVIADGWSMGLIQKELTHGYRKHLGQVVDPLPRLSLQYADFSVWQREQLPRTEGKHIAYWRRELEGAPDFINLTTDFPRGRESSVGGVCDFELPVTLLQGARLLARKNQATPFSLILSALSVLLAHYSRQRDIVIGWPVAGRNHDDLVSLVGCFINTSLVRVRLDDPALDFHGLMRQVGLKIHHSLEHVDLPFEKLVDELDVKRVVDRTPLFQVMLVMQPPVESPAKLPLVQSQPLDVDPGHAKFDLSMNLTEYEERIYGGLRYKADLFERATIMRMLTHFLNLFKGLVENPNQPLFTLSVLGEEERKDLIYNRNANTLDHEDVCFHQLVAWSWEAYPDRVALSCNGITLTYSELRQRTDKLAYKLLKRGLLPGQLVPICMDRDVDMIVAQLAVLRSGGAYIPLDPATPSRLLHFQIEDVGAPFILTKRDGARNLTKGSEIIDVEKAIDELFVPSLKSPNSLPHDPAYFIYTSGSSGRPKGVGITHRALVNYALGVVNRLDVPLGLRYAMVSTIAADLGITGQAASLITAGSLHIIQEDLLTDPDAFGAYMRQHQIDFLKIVPSHLNALLSAQNPENVLPSQRLVLGGEASSSAWVNRIRALKPGMRIFNHYGPTESTVGMLTYSLEDRSLNERMLPLGSPIPNTQAFVCDGALRLTPVGVPGELVIGGRGLAMGYWNRAALTAERFVPNPFAATRGERIYKTGDLVRYSPSGPLMFLGRLDFQVKIRGFRIEPNGIEATISRYAGVDTALVMVREDQPGDKCLVAYIATREKNFNSVQLKRFLQEELPAYMVPSALVVLAQLPITANGKIDRAALPAPIREVANVDTHIAPRTDREKLLCDIWAELLGLEEVGIGDNFFVLGGDSIILIQMISRVRRQGYQLFPKQVFQHQTIEHLATVLDDLNLVVAEQGAVTGRVPLTPIVARFFERNLVDPYHYNQALLLSCKDPIPPSVLQQAVLRLLEHHDMLRIRAHRENEEWVLDLPEPPRESGDLIWDRGIVEAQEAGHENLLQAIMVEAQQSLNLTEGPALRFVWIHHQPSKFFRLFIAIHHLAVDGVSWRILLEDLEAALSQGLKDPKQTYTLPVKTSSLREWATALANRADAFEKGRDFWLQKPLDVVHLPLDFPVQEGANAERWTQTAFLSLSKEETDNLLHRVPAAYHTEIQEVLLTALVSAFQNWTGNSRLWIHLEGHGREDIFDNLDISRTVGWFTSLFPVCLDLGGDNYTGDHALSRSLRRIKEELRAIPMNGMSFGMWRYLSSDQTLINALKKLPLPQVCFNYFGQLDQTLKECAILKSAPEDVPAMRGASQERAHILEFNSMITSGCLILHCNFSSKLHHRKTIERLLSQLRLCLVKIIAHCCSLKCRVYSPADFPVADFNVIRLDQFLGQIPSRINHNTIEDIYPMTPLQKGMLYHSLINPNTGVYVLQFSCDIKGVIAMAALEKAWEFVANRYDILRMVVGEMEGAEPMHIILKHYTIPITYIDLLGVPSSSQKVLLDRMVISDRLLGFHMAYSTLQRLSVIRLETCHIRLIWTHHHIASDGWSTPIVLGDVFSAYYQLLAGVQPVMAPVKPFREYIRWLKGRDHETSMLFWRNYLDGFDDPTPLMKNDLEEGQRDYVGARKTLNSEISETNLARLLEISKACEITFNTLISGVWGLVLQRVSQKDDVIMGTSSSGRPPELAGAEEMVGPFIATLPVRVLSKDQQYFKSWLRDLHESLISRDPHQYLPLVKIQQCSCLKPGVSLFQSLLQFTNYPIRSQQSKNPGFLEIESAHTEEQDNFPLTLAVSQFNRLVIKLNYDSLRLEAGKARKMLALLVDLLKCLPELSDQTVGAIREHLHQLDKDWINAQREALKSNQKQRLKLGFKELALKQ